MTWEYEYDAAADETAFYWVGGGETKSTVVPGNHTNAWTNGFPDTPAARDAIATLIQEAGTPERIRMQYDFNYGFYER